ncbi:HEAT repeat domain-containing protein [Sorangium sp. So ce204]|uniref:HEAT repeat domain-containing protein n=1 Tax=Sorangium sp. So ce204 TaxID=3133288 RepID=UPI003F607A9A
MSHAIGHYEKVRALAIGPRLLAVGGVRAPAPGEPRGTRETQTTPSPASASQVTLFDHVANKPVRSIDVPAHVLGLAFAGDLLAAACSDGALRLLAGGGADVRAIDAHPGGATAIAAGVWQNAGARLATVGVDGALRVFRVGEAAGSPAPPPGAAVEIASFALSAAPLRAVAFDPAGELCAAAGDDGVVRVVTLSTGAVRAMPGHDGPVTALAFTPRDGRLASGGDDGTVRLWYLVGDVECEVRGADGSGHAGGVRALLCLPAPPPQEDGKESGDRLLSAGADGAIRIHRLEDKRKPRTLETSALALHALALAPAAARKGARGQAGRGGADAKDGLGAVFAAGDRRTVWRFPIDAAGAPADGTAELTHGFDVLAQALSGARPARESAVKTLASLDEPEALEAALPVLRSDRDAEVRALAARELGAKGRRGARAKLREALDDESPNVRMAALEALRAIERDTPLAPLRAALDARAADVQRRALLELGKLYGSSPLVPGLIAEKLAGRDASVRLTALDQLQQIYPDGPQPLRTAFERGPADLRVEALIRAALAGWLSAPEFAPIAARALDDEDAEVRRSAFAAKVIERRALAHALEARDEDLGRAAIDIARRAAEVLRRAGAGAGGAEKPAANAKDGAKDAAKAADEAAIKAARARIPGVGSPGAEPAEADLEPLLTAMACRTPDTAVRGARGLAQLGDTRALGALLQLTREQDPSLRRQAATALAELRDTRAEKRLIWMLDDADGAVRAAAHDAYARLQPSAPLTVAEASLRSSQEDIRVRGLDRLVALAGEGKGPRSPEAEALLADAIEDESPKVRREAFRTLWSWHASDPQTALDRAQLARFPDLRLRAVEELKAHGEQPWAAERLHAAIGDRDAGVAQAAYDAVVKLRGKEAAEPHLAAMASIHPSVRESGARGAAHLPAGDDARNALLRLLATRVPVGEAARSALSKLLEDEHAGPRIAAIEALDRLLPGEAGPLHIGLQSSHLDLRVRAAELCAVRRDEQLINPMRALLADQSLLNAGRGSAFAVPSAQVPIQVLGPLRARAATALATLGSPRLVKYFATELLKDEYPDVREQAARGLAMAARRGEEGYLLDAMGHADVAVRSWAADGLARLGDVRALPVLTGTLRHEHPPIRVATIMSFAALGPEGYGGMLQGLEDSSREVQEIVFAIVLARDLRAFRRGDPPDLLTSALSSQRSDVRFAAARALELRTDPELYLAHLIEALMPPRPDTAEQGRAADGEKPAGMKDWPPEVARGRILVGLAEALASDDPQQRYAAAQVLRIRRKPVEYFREAKRVAALRPAGAHVVADTTPRAAEESDTKPAKGWLRRLFAQPEPSGQSGQSGQKESDRPAGDAVPEGEQRRLRWLAFGAYMGLLRQVSAGDDEAHRTRRDAIDRIVDVCAKGHVSSTAAVPPLVRALDDPHHLVRKAAFAGLKALFPAGAGEPLALGLASASADVARTALDEIAARGGDARPEIVRALSSALPDVRRYAFELLERLSPKGSLDPLLAALGSEHADLRLGVLERLASSSDPRIVPALCRAMESDHDDLRLRAAELLARSRDDRAVDVLSAFLREGAAAPAARARKALVALASDAAVRALAARMDEAATPADRAALAGALGSTRNPAATGPLAARFDDEAAEVRSAALKACLEIVDKGREREKRETALALAFLAAATRAKDPALRLAAARELDLGDDPAQNDLLVALFADRDLPTRVAAVTSYAKRVKGDRQQRAPSGPLEAVLRAGARELVLPAAEGVAERGLASALRPLLLVVRAGEPGERERALLALGTLGDARALEELEAVAAGGTKEAPIEPSMQAAATEALGRIAPKLGSAELRKRASERVEQALHADSIDLRESAAKGVRWIGGERARVLLEELVRAGDTPERLRVVAVNELGLLGDGAAEPALARALDARSGEVRKNARKALEKLFPGERTRVELLAVGSEYDDIAGPAASYLAAEADPAELLPRLAALKDEDLRQRLAMGLLRRGALPVAALLRMLEDERAPARQEAARLIAAGTVAGDRGALAGALAAAAQRTAERWSAAHGDERSAEAAAWRELLWAAGRAGATAMAPALRALLSNDSAPGEVRREAVRALGALESAARSAGAAPPAGAVEALTAALEDMDAGVRGSASAALAALAPDGSAAIAVAVRPFDPVAFGPTARVASPEALGALAATEPGRRLALPSILARHDAAALAPLISLARGSGGDASARLDAIAALGRAGGERALEALAALAFDKEKAKEKAEIAVRKAAYRAYRRAKRKAADPRAARLAAARSSREPETPEGVNA